MRRSQSLDAARWTLVRDIFDSALDVDGSSRSELVAKRCAGDPELHAEVMGLLEAEARLEAESAEGYQSFTFLESSFGSLAQVLVGAGAETLGPQLPFAWGPLQVIAAIGAGSFGRVYRAHDPTLRRDVALKLRPVDVGGHTVDGEAHLEEARRLARVRHPNVLVVHGAEVHDGYAGIWTDLVRGETLDVSLRRNGPFAREALIRAGIDLCRALEAVHASGIIHGDVKPSNAMQDEDGRVLLMDFGSGRLDRIPTDKPDAPSLERPRQGTPVAMAPELWNSGAPSASSDLYALGVLLYRVASGQYPFQGSGLREIQAAVRAQDVIPLDELRPDLPSAFVRVVHRALAADPHARPANAAELQWLIAASLGSEEVESSAGETEVEHLPHFSTRFVGRASELRQLRSLLTETGLVTVVGAGGCGKTRLAARVAGELNSSLPGGATWIDLASIDDGARVATAVTHAAGLADQIGKHPEEMLVQWIEDRGMLLVLDNAEHLRAHVSRLTQLLIASCSGLRLLVTSRQRLSIAGERTFRLAPMAIPSERASAEGLAILESDSVRLFLDRTRRSGDEFRITPANAAEVARIVRRVEGIPLAVELAAARVSALGVAVLAERLDESFRLLNARNRVGSKRHSTLATSIEWSHDLLEPKEAKLFAMLAVFSGGWSLAGAEAVCVDAAEVRDGHHADAVAPEEVVDLLSALVEHSLVSFESHSNEPRYRLLEMVRAFAMERLEASGRADRIRDRHLAWMEREAVIHGPGIHGPEMHRHMAWFDREQGNVRVALQRQQALVRAGTSTTDRWIPFCLNLRPYWYLRGHLNEGCEAFDQLVSHVPADSPYRAVALTALASLQRALGKTHRAIETAKEAVDIARRLNNPDRLAIALSTVGMLHQDTGVHGPARKCYLETLEIRERTPNPSHSIATLSNLGVLEASVGDLASAQYWYERALEFSKLQEDQSTIGPIMGNLALTMIERGEIDAARPLAAESLNLVRRSSGTSTLWTAARPATLLHIADGRLSDASLLLREILDGMGKEPMVHGRIGILDTLVDLIIARGQNDEAAEILGSIDAERERSSLPIQVGFRSRWDQRHEELRRSLGAERFDAAWVRGRLRHTLDMLEYAKQLL